MENKTYELELVPIKIEGTSIELWKVKRWKGAVETEYESEAEYISNFPLWIKIWEASIVLCEHLSQGAIDTDAKILEIGAGIGLAGMMLGAMGYQVTVTDHNEDALALLKKNIEHNKLKNVQVKKLDWFHPDTEETYDIIFGSELIYKGDKINPLLDLFRKCIKPNGVIFIAHDINRQNIEVFSNKAERIFQVGSSAKTLKTGSDKHRIVIHTIRYK